MENINFPEYTNDCSYFLFQILLKENLTREKIIAALQEKNIGFSIHYATPVPLMTFYKTKYGFAKGQFKNAESYSNKNISLPVHSNLKNEDVHYVCSSLNEILNNAKQ